MNKRDAKTIREAFELAALRRQSSGPSTSIMGAGLLHPPLPAPTVALALEGLRGLAAMRRADEKRKREAAENAHGGAWGNAADDMERRFRKLEAESRAAAERFERLAQVVEIEGLPIDL